MSLLYHCCNNEFEVLLSKTTYEREAILSVVYKFSEIFVIKIEEIKDDINNIKMIVVKKNDEEVNDMDIEMLLTELADQQLRLDILKRTSEIRKRIIDKAFEPILDVKK